MAALVRGNGGAMELVGTGFQGGVHWRRCLRQSIALHCRARTLAGVRRLDSMEAEPAGERQRSAQGRVLGLPHGHSGRIGEHGVFSSTCEGRQGLRRGSGYGAISHGYGAARSVVSEGTTWLRTMDRVVVGVCGHLSFKRVSVQVLIGRDDLDTCLAWICHIGVSSLGHNGRHSEVIDQLHLQRALVPMVLLGDGGTVSRTPRGDPSKLGAEQGSRHERHCGRRLEWSGSVDQLSCAGIWRQSIHRDLVDLALSAAHGGSGRFISGRTALLEAGGRSGYGAFGSHPALAGSHTEAGS